MEVVTANATAHLKTLNVKIGLEYYPLLTLAPLFNQILIAKDSVDGANTIYNVWLDYPGKIQKIKGTVDGVADTEITFDPLKDDVNDVYEISKSQVNIPEFIAGTCYLIPYTADDVTNVVPPIAPNYRQDDTDGLLLPTHWVYKAEETAQVRNGNPFSGYTIIIKPSALDTALAKKAEAKIALDVNFGRAMVERGK